MRQHWQEWRIHRNGQRSDYGRYREKLDYVGNYLPDRFRRCEGGAQRGSTVIGDNGITLRRYRRP